MCEPCMHIYVCVCTFMHVTVHACKSVWIVDRCVELMYSSFKYDYDRHTHTHTEIHTHIHSQLSYLASVIVSAYSTCINYCCKKNQRYCYSVLVLYLSCIK